MITNKIISQNLFDKRKNDRRYLGSYLWGKQLIKGFESFAQLSYIWFIGPPTTINFKVNYIDGENRGIRMDIYCCLHIHFVLFLSSLDYL